MKTREEKLRSFIEKADEVHGGRYDYSKVDYYDSKTSVCIICPEHGEFMQTPAAHVRGNKCPKCANKERGRYKRLDTEKFIKRAEKIHKGKYDYSKVEYTSVMGNVTIVCPEHGEFTQKAMNHLLGQGCPKCMGRGLSNDEVVSRFRSVHGDRYDYSKTEYKGFNEKVLITCPKHGDFQQNSYVHLTGSGCPYCKNSKGEDAIAHFLKKHGIKYIPQYRFTNNYSFCENKYIYVDFFLPNDSIIIEFNGLQHYGAVDFWGGEKVFQKQKNRDETVRMYCKDNNIRLLEIPYTKMGDINILIEDFLKVISH